MSKKLVVGISFCENTVNTVVLEKTANGFIVRVLNEIEDAVKKNGWYLAPLEGMKDIKLSKVSKVSVAIDNSSAVMLTFPVDNSLRQDDRAENLNWELSNYIEDYKSENYINDVHLLQTWARDWVIEILSVTVARSLVTGIQELLSGKKLELDTIDVYHFGGQNSLLFNYTEARTKSIALVSMNKNRIDVGLLASGRLRGYRYAVDCAGRQKLSWFKELFKDFPVSDIFLHGTDISQESVEELRSELNINAVLLNPFRALDISKSPVGFEKFRGQEHRFAASVGIAIQRW